jgi:hypothetical protein
MRTLSKTTKYDKLASKNRNYGNMECRFADVLNKYKEQTVTMIMLECMARGMFFSGRLISPPTKLA